MAGAGVAGAGEDDSCDARGAALVKQALGNRIQLSSGRADVVYEQNTLNLDRPTAEHLEAELRPSLSA